MTDFLSALSFSASGMAAQSDRLRHVSENIANADTPGYHRKLVSFQEAMDSGEVMVGPVILDQSQRAKVYDPGDPLAGGPEVCRPLLCAR